MAITMKVFEDYIEKYSKIIERALYESISKTDENFYGGMRYAISSGGKRVRPTLLLGTVDSFGGDIKEAIYPAVACELLHNFFLVHDDIEDGDTIRRGMESVWKKYGIPNAINIGDGLVGLSYKILLRSKDVIGERKTIKLIEEFTQSLLITGEGQAYEISSRGKEIEEEKYKEIVELKTGRYLILPVILGLIIAERESLIKKVERYGRYVGPLFQIRDDLIDLTTGKGRGEIGCDIKEGKPSIIVVYACEYLRDMEKKELMSILMKDRENTSEKDVKRAIELIKNSGAIERALRTESKLKEMAIKSAKKLPDKLSNFLISFAEFTSSRAT